MSIHADTVWETRTVGSANNGGGFYNRTPGTSVDYTQQVAAQLALTDLAMTTGGITLTSVTGGFTSAMVGNIIHITSGTNFTAGFYEIIAMADTNTVTLDRDATDGTNGSIGVGNVGGSLAHVLDLAFDGSDICAGNTVYIKADGEYVWIAIKDTRALDGTASAPIKFIGYNTTRTDEPTGTNRPMLSFGAYYCVLGSFMHCFNLRTTSTSSYGGFIPYESNSFSFNCFYENTSGTADRPGVSLSSYSKLVNCECVSNAGNACSVANYVSSIVNCYTHDSKIGIKISSYGITILNSIIDTCLIGTNLASNDNITFINNTIYNSSTAGINATDSANNVFLNNIIAGCAVGILWTSKIKSNVWDYNNWYGNTKDMVHDGTNEDNSLKGSYDIDADPQFENAAGGDFSLGSGSTSIDAGLSMTLGV